MPEPVVLALVVCDGRCLVSVGRSLVYHFDVDDIGMRNLAIVALTDAGRRVDEVAALFGLTATYVSMLRGRARAQGSAGLVRRRGRPRKLSDRQVSQARVWSGQGQTQQVIADRLGVAQSVISDLLARLAPVPVQEPLPATDATEPADGTVPPGSVMAAPVAAQPHDDDVEAIMGEVEPVGSEPVGTPPGTPVAGFAGSARIATGAYRCRYAGAMLLFPYLHRVGAEAIFGTLTGGPARRYDDLAVLSTATISFALGTGTVEGTKHLRRAEAGAAVGLAMVPELATLRPRLSALADACDPLGLQRAFAAGMLGQSGFLKQGVAYHDSWADALHVGGYRILPEGLDPGTLGATSRGNQLRPEYVDSAFTLWMQTGNRVYVDRAVEYYLNQRATCRVADAADNTIGYTILNDVTTRPEIQGDLASAYWYSENMKYYFLIFGRSPRFSYAQNAYLTTEGNVLRGLL